MKLLQVIAVTTAAIGRVSATHPTTSPTPQPSFTPHPSVATKAGAGRTRGRTTFTSAEKVELEKIESVRLITYESPPFVFADESGFALDLAREVVTHLFGTLPVNVEFESGNFVDIVTSLAQQDCDSTVNPHRLCIGASALSVTANRSITVDYLQTYYLSGLKVLTRVVPDYGEMAGKMALEILSLFGGTFAFVAFILLVVAPIAWVCESLEPESIFSPGLDVGEKPQQPTGGPPRRQLTRRASVHGLSEVEKEKVILQKTMKNALKWVIGTFAGSTLATPHSKGAKAVGVLVNGLFQFVVILTTASAAALLGSDGASSGSASTIAEMGELGYTICVDSWSEAYVRSANKNGAVIHESSTYKAMLDRLWDGTCDAAVYDAPLLEYALAEAQRGGVGESYGLVGELLNFDPYALCMPFNHPLNKVVNRVTIDTVRDADFRSILDSKYFGYSFQASGEEGDGGAITIAVLIPIFIIVLTMYLTRSYFLRQKDKIAARIHADVLDGHTLDVVALRDEAKNVSHADIAMIPSTNLVHDLAFELNAVKRLVCELLIANGVTSTSSDEAPQQAKVPHNRDKKALVANLAWQGHTESVDGGFGSGDAVIE